MTVECRGATIRLTVDGQVLRQQGNNQESMLMQALVPKHLATFLTIMDEKVQGTTPVHELPPQRK